MRDAGIDNLLAQHVAHLFIRDPVSLFSEKVNQNDEEDSDHFEVHIFQSIVNLRNISNIILFLKTEPSINQLADDAFQATATQEHYWLARRIPAM